MKIERISENQIRCTLSKHDLMERHLKLSELAYGSEKAKDLFRDMMEQANIDFGFDADDIPLMIEAIPTSRDSIVLVITKVDNPDELDERFSHFGIPDSESPFAADDDEEDFDDELMDEEEDDNGSILSSPEVVNCFEKLNELIAEVEAREGKPAPPEFIPLSEALQRGKNAHDASVKQKKKEQKNLAKMKVFSFDSLNVIIEVARTVAAIYSSKNTLWKNPKDNRYYLMLNNNDSKSSFQAACSVISEFGTEETITYASKDYYNEHFQIIVKEDALKQLSRL